MGRAEILFAMWTADSFQDKGQLGLGSGEGVQKGVKAGPGPKECSGKLLQTAPLWGLGKEGDGAEQARARDTQIHWVRREWGSGEHTCRTKQSPSEMVTPISRMSTASLQNDKGVGGFGTWAWNQRAPAQSRAQETSKPSHLLRRGPQVRASTAMSHKHKKDTPAPSLAQMGPRVPPPEPPRGGPGP